MLARTRSHHHTISCHVCVRTLAMSDALAARSVQHLLLQIQTTCIMRAPSRAFDSHVRAWCRPFLFFVFFVCVCVCVSHQVGFTYPTRPGATVLDDLSLEIPAGSVQAVVGGSGSGKSTLFALLLRLYEADRGSIFIDGRDVRAPG
jgi:ABC-type multidrug transport system fused ATPase/permease subunit